MPYDSALSASNATCIKLADYADFVLPTLYQQQTHLTKYSRWIDELGRREFWHETVFRYVNFMVNHTARNFGYRLTEDEQRDIFESILFLRVMPSMRAMMTAGPALERDNASAYNPVVGSTCILTREYGVVPISDLIGRTSTVLNKDGRWASAEFRNYGEQPIFEVECRLNSNTVKTVLCTANHRWVTCSGEVLATMALRNGDRLPFANAPSPAIDDDYRLGVIHGLVYGDGTALYAKERIAGYHIRICQDIDDLLPWFSEFAICYPPSANGDPVVMLYDDFAKTHGLKDLPPETESGSYFLGFLRGWLAADGYVSKSSQVSLCLSGDDITWLRRMAPRFGWVIQHAKKQPAETNFGKRKRDSWIVYFSRSAMNEDDFLIGRKRSRFKALMSHYVVSGVRDTGITEQVYCAEVPDTNTFVLDGGLVTGNCAYAPVDSMVTHDESFYLSMCSVGVGFSIERQYISQLPDLPRELHETDTVIVVPDSRIGWAASYRQFLGMLFNGFIPKWDVSKVRPAGAPLKTFGGRASGPGPLVDLFRHAITVFKQAIDAGQRRLTSLQNHDLMTKMADVAVSGGVRRAAMISLSNPSDQRMRDAKAGEWWSRSPHFRLANNSAVWTDMPEPEIFLEEWLALVRSKSGERGIINRKALVEQARRSRRLDVDSYADHYGVNPCSEIIMRPRQFCNLTTNILRHDDDLKDIVQKIRVSTIIGTLQSSLTDFRYLGPDWRRNCEEERLLGVSLNGIMDNRFMAGLDYVRDGSYLSEDFMRDGVKVELPEVLSLLRDTAINVNREWADKIGINPSAAITTVKPEGNNSNLVDCRPGLHGAHARSYYIRTNRANKVDKMAQFMISKGVVAEDDVSSPDTAYVLYFPIQVPDNAISRHDYTAIEHLRVWSLYQEFYCEHKPSITVSVKDHEWIGVGAYVYDNFDKISGVAFLPFDGGNYRQAPYMDCSKEEYEQLVTATPSSIDWSEFSEDADYTEGATEFACVGNVCSL